MQTPLQIQESHKAALRRFLEAQDVNPTSEITPLGKMAKAIKTELSSIAFTLEEGHELLSLENAAILDRIFKSYTLYVQKDRETAAWRNLLEWPRREPVLPFVALAPRPVGTPGQAQRVPRSPPPSARSSLLDGATIPGYGTNTEVTAPTAAAPSLQQGLPPETAAAGVFPRRESSSSIVLATTEAGENDALLAERPRAAAASASARTARAQAATTAATVSHQPAGSRAARSTSASAAAPPRSWLGLLPWSRTAGQAAPLAVGTNNPITAATAQAVHVGDINAVLDGIEADLGQTGVGAREGMRGATGTGPTRSAARDPDIVPNVLNQTTEPRRSSSVPRTNKKSWFSSLFSAGTAAEPATPSAWVPTILRRLGITTAAAPTTAPVSILNPVPAAISASARTPERGAHSSLTGVTAIGSGPGTPQRKVRRLFERARSSSAPRSNTTRYQSPLHPPGAATGTGVTPDPAKRTPGYAAALPRGRARAAASFDSTAVVQRNPAAGHISQEDPPASAAHLMRAAARSSGSARLTSALRAARAEAAAAASTPATPSSALIVAAITRSSGAAPSPPQPAQLQEMLARSLPAGDTTTRRLAGELDAAATPTSPSTSAVFAARPVSPADVDTSAFSTNSAKRALGEVGAHRVAVSPTHARGGPRNEEEALTVVRGVGYPPG